MTKDILNETELNDRLQKKNCNIRALVLEECVSTNTLARQIAIDTPNESALIVARRQTGGRGRMGRSFHSPAETGVYFSILFPQKGALSDALGITCAAAVAVMRAILSTTGIQTKIKWVNDLLLDEKKVCGILTEAVTMGDRSSLIVGIGINLRPMEFPAELADIAGSLNQTDLPRAELIAEITANLLPYLQNTSDNRWLEDYRRHSCVLGKEILRIENGVSKPCIAEELDHRGRLAVRYSDGSREILQSGEISIRLNQSPTHAL